MAWSALMPARRWPMKFLIWLIVMAMPRPAFAAPPRRSDAALLMPITLPVMSNSGPPELPGFTAVSTWMASVYSMGDCGLIFR